MDAFEQIIGQLLEEEKYWVRHSVKIDLSKEEKKLIGTPKTPRPEIDIVALDIKENIIYLLEVKSFLDSNGVYYEHVSFEQTQQIGRYKLFCSENYRTILSRRLKNDWIQSGHINSDTKICFGLIAGNVYKNREADINNYFKIKGWLFWGPTMIKDKVRQLADKKYEDNAVTIVTKLLIR